MRKELTMELTNNQTRAMTALIKSCLGNMGGKTLADLQDDPFTWVDASDLVEAGWGQKEAEGTFGSLVAADLVYLYDQRSAGDGGNLYSLAEDWDVLRKFHS